MVIHYTKKRYIKCMHLYLYVFVARQHAMHAERDIVLPILSVCPSVCFNAGIYCVKTNGHEVKRFDDLVGESFSFLWRQRHYKTPSGGAKCMGLENFANIALYLIKRYQIGR